MIKIAITKGRIQKQVAIYWKIRTMMLNQF